MLFRPILLGVTAALTATHAAVVDPAVLDACPGYKATNVKTKGGTLTADLVLAGKACNVFGADKEKLLLYVEYQTTSRIHLKITDASSARFEVPQSVLPLPPSSILPSPPSADIQFNYTASPFSFTVYRTGTSEVLFSTVGHPLIFEPQYLRLKTTLPKSANIYGLGEHTNPFRLDPHNTTITLWSRDSYGVSPGTNLYGNHPIYFEHRTTGTHGVFLRNANGMDIKLTDFGSKPSLEYNVIGGVLDFYFLGGSEPEAVARQYAELVGKPAEIPFWGLGFHQCRFGYKDFIDVANVITQYAEAGIPLETMWADIDYMDRRRTFTLDPDYFPVSRMREIVNYLHSKGQRFILMTDPAIAYTPGEKYGPFDRGSNPNIWMKQANGSDYLGLVWPGVTVYPDWFNPLTQKYWTNEFATFYSPTEGVDIDGAWIDMSEPASFCDFPCTDPFAQAKAQNLPPPRSSPPPDRNAVLFQKGLQPRADDRNLFNPPYAIQNAAGGLANKTAHPDVLHANGMIEYDAHNLFGTMMSIATQKAMEARRPGKRTLIIARSTFAGAGTSVGKWLGDNISLWEHYRFSIAGMLGMTTVYQIPMVGSDICGFAGNTTEELCARWATLGAFYPFMRNHNADTSVSQEFYLFKNVASAAKNALDVRYRLMDYIYTAFHQAHTDGTPVAHPLWFKYPKDSNTFAIDLQFLYGDSILVSPVTDEGATSVTIYLPKDIFYDFKTLAPVKGTGATVLLPNVPVTDIPLHIRGGSVIPLRVQKATLAMTTNEVRERDFELVVAPGTDGKAFGRLYMDDGESITQKKTTQAVFAYAPGRLSVTGSFGYESGPIQVAKVKFAGITKKPVEVKANGKKATWVYDAGTKVLEVAVALKLGQLDVTFT